MIDRDFEQVSEEHMKSMTKPEEPVQEPQRNSCAHCGLRIYQMSDGMFAGQWAHHGSNYRHCHSTNNSEHVATPAPSQPSLLEAVEQLRAIPAAWKERPDPLAELHEIRHGSQPAGAREWLRTRDINLPWLSEIAQLMEGFAAQQTAAKDADNKAADEYIANLQARRIAAERERDSLRAENAALKAGKDGQR